MGNLKFVLGICFISIISIQGELFQRTGQTNQDGFVVAPALNNPKNAQRFQTPTTNYEQRDTPYLGSANYDFVTNFAWNLFLSTNNVHEKSVENLVLSPISPQLLFSLIGDISPARIREEFTTCLGPLNSDKISSVVKSYKRTAISKSKNLIKIASSAFYDEKLELSETFVSKLQKSNIQSVKIDFQSPDAANKINDWAYQATQGEIPKIIDSQSLTTDKLIISNTVYFRGVWMNKFNETDPGTFYQTDNAPIPVEFMKSKSHLTYGYQGPFKWVELKYSNDEFSMLILLPKNRYGLEAAITEMSPEILRNILNERREGYTKRVKLSLPKFSISSQFSLIPPLRKLGLLTPFTSNRDIPLLTSDSGPIQIGKVLHEAKIRIDEYGTVASAATTVSVITLSANSNDDEIIFNVDQPFLAIIVDNAKNIPLFISKIYSPQ